MDNRDLNHSIVRKTTLNLNSQIALCKGSLQFARSTASEQIREMALANALKAYEDIQNLNEKRSMADRPLYLPSAQGNTALASHIECQHSCGPGSSVSEGPRRFS